MRNCLFVPPSVLLCLLFATRPLLLKSETPVSGNDEVRISLIHGGGTSARLRLHINTNGCWVPFSVQANWLPPITMTNIVAVIENEAPWMWSSPIPPSIQYENDLFIFSGCCHGKEWCYRTCYPDSRLEGLLGKMISIFRDSENQPGSIRFKFVPGFGFRPDPSEEHLLPKTGSPPPHSMNITISVSNQATVTDLIALIQEVDYYRVQRWYLEQGNDKVRFFDASFDCLPKMEAIDADLEESTQITEIQPIVISYPTLVSGRIQHVSESVSSIRLPEMSRPVCIFISSNSPMSVLTNRLFQCQKDGYFPIFIKTKKKQTQEQ